MRQVATRMAASSTGRDSRWRIHTSRAASTRATCSGSVSADVALKTRPGLAATTSPIHGDPPIWLASRLANQAAAAMVARLRNQNTSGSHWALPRLSRLAIHPRKG